MVKKRNLAEKLKETTSKVIQKKLKIKAIENARPKKSLSEEYLENEHRTKNAKKDIIDSIVRGVKRFAGYGLDSYSAKFTYDYFYCGRDSSGREYFGFDGGWELDCADAYTKEHIIPSLNRKFGKGININFSRKFSYGSDSGGSSFCGANTHSGSDPHSYQQYEITW